MGNDKSARQSWCYADAYKRSVISGTILLTYIQLFCHWKIVWCILSATAGLCAIAYICSNCSYFVQRGTLVNSLVFLGMPLLCTADRATKLFVWLKLTSAVRSLVCQLGSQWGLWPCIYQDRWSQGKVRCVLGTNGETYSKMYNISDQSLQQSRWPPASDTLTRSFVRYKFVTCLLTYTICARIHGNSHQSQVNEGTGQPFVLATEINLRTYL